MTADESDRVRSRTTALCLAGAAVCVLAFWGTGLRYDGFRLPYGIGVQEIHPAELVFAFWYMGLGIPAVLLLATGLLGTGGPRRVIAALGRAAERPFVVPALVVGVGLLALAVRAWILQFAPVADDESTYVFIARTLLGGGVTNPSPGDEAFFRNQFIVLDASTWYGKYPIGHPLLLALGEAIGLRALVGPVLTAASLALCHAIGRRLYPGHAGLLAVALLAVSPQFVLTGATELSQTTSTFCLLLALFALVRLDEDGRLRHAALAGAALGFGVLARPMPGALFVAVALAYGLVRARGGSIRELAGRAVAVGAPLAVAAVVLASVHYAQTSDVLRSGYQAYHGAGYTAGWMKVDWVAASFSGALLRQNLWLFGWPISFAFLVFAVRDRASALLWAFVVAEYAYRLLVPKTVVSSTGPVYVAEVVPLLALLSARGMSRAASWLARHAFDRGPERVAALAMAAVGIACVTFVPIQLRDLSRSAEHWNTANALLELAGSEKSLVFASSMVDVEAARSWAYYPPNPSPDLSDDHVFVRLPGGPDAARAAWAFWRRRFPDREAWIFGWIDGEPRLQQLPEQIAHARP